VPPLKPGEQIVASMQFEVEVPDNFGPNYGIFAATSGVLSFSHGYPMVAVYDTGWETEIPSPIGDATFNDASFFLVRINASQGLVIAASGIEIEKNIENGKQQVTYALGPGRDFYFAASKDFIKSSRSTDGIDVNYYSPPTQQAFIDKTLETAIQALNIYSTDFAPYPYRELDLVATPMLALGMEFPGIVAITDDFTKSEFQKNITAPVFVEFTVAHEVGHQWFYNLVGNDQLNEPWLDESLTQYATLDYFSTRYGSDGAQGVRSSLYDRWNEVERSEIPIGLPVKSYDRDEYSAIIYGRGGLFFEALKNKMGDEAFQAFIQDYTTTLAWDISSTEKLEDFAEKHCDCSLNPLFRKWVFPE
jgi:aminopeptidase N